MAYQIDRYNNTILTTIQDGTLDNTTDIKLIGKNFAGYGEIQNENFLYLLENFSGVVEPARPISGQLWYDSGNEKIKFYDGTKFRSASGAETGPVQPTGQARGDFWWNTSNDELYVYNGTEYVSIGPSFAGFENTKFIADTLFDTQSVAHEVIKAVVNNKVTFLISNDEYDINASTPVTGFSRVKKGITLVNTNEFGLSSDSYLYWGTSSNSLRLGGVQASDYLLKSNPSFTGVVRFTDTGFTVGNDNDLAVFVENGNEAVLQNQIGSSNKIKFRLNNGSSSATHSTSITAVGVEPAATNQYSLGTTDNRWQNVFSINENVSNSLQVGGATTLGSTLVVTGATTLNSSLSVANSVTLNDTLSVTGNVALNNAITVDGAANLNGSITLGDTAADSVIFNAELNSSIVPRTTNAFELGSSVRRWSTVFATTFNGLATSAQYADLAEMYLADKDYDFGTVVKIGGSAEVTETTEWADLDVFGVVSQNPAYLMNSEADGVPVALAGRVPVKVVGAVKKGDRLISSSVPGHAEAVTQDYDYEAVIGRSLEDKDDIDKGIVEAVVGVK